MRVLVGSEPGSKVGSRTEITVGQATELIPRHKPDDFCRGQFKDRAGRHCLMGWLAYHFGCEGKPMLPPCWAINLLEDEVREISGKPHWIGNWNDDRDTTDEQLAAVWNRFAERANQQLCCTHN